MANVKTAYDTEAQAITCTIASLANAAARESTAIDNTTNLYLDVAVFVQIKTQSGTPAGQKACNIYVAGTVDKTTPFYPDAVTGTDAAITLDSPVNLALLGVVQTPTSAATKKAGPFSIVKALGFMPEKWSIVIENQSGIALDATESNHKKLYQGIYATVV